MARIIKIKSFKTGSLLQIDLKDIKELYIDKRQSNKVLCIEYFKLKKLELKVEEGQYSELENLFNKILDARNDFYEEEKEDKIKNRVVSELLEMVTAENKKIIENIGLDKLKEETSVLSSNLDSLNKKTTNLSDSLKESEELLFKVKDITTKLHQELFGE